MCTGMLARQIEDERNGKEIGEFFLYIDRLYVDEDEEEGKILFTVKIYMMLISFSNIL